MNYFTGGTPNKSIKNYWRPEIPWCSVKDLGNSLYISSTIDMISYDGLNNSTSNIVYAGEIILCSRMAVGKIRIPLIDMAINQDLKCLLVSKNICKKYFIMQSSISEFKSTGTTVKGLDFEDYLHRNLLLPPLFEQSRIVKKVENIFDCLGIEI